MKKFAIKAILFYTISLVAAMLLTGLTNAALYWFLRTAGLSDLGNMLLFRLGLALVETGTCVYAVSQLSEDILYKVEETTTTPPAINGEET